MAEDVQFRDGAFFELGRCLPGEIAGFELLSRIAESGTKIDEAVAKGGDRRVFVGLWEERMFRGDFLGLGEEMQREEGQVYFS
jgi:hypothetical protein